MCIGCWYRSDLDVLHFSDGRRYMDGNCFYMIPVGVIGGLAAAVFGLIDWSGIPGGTRAKSVATLHGLGMCSLFSCLVEVGCCGEPSPSDPGILAYILSFAGIAVVSVTGWLGGELVD